MKKTDKQSADTKKKVFSLRAERVLGRLKVTFEGDDFKEMVKPLTTQHHATIGYTDADGNGLTVERIVDPSRVPDTITNKCWITDQNGRDLFSNGKPNMSFLALGESEFYFSPRGVFPNEGIEEWLNSCRSAAEHLYANMICRFDKKVILTSTTEAK